MVEIKICATLCGQEPRRARCQHPICNGVQQMAFIDLKWLCPGRCIRKQRSRTLEERFTCILPRHSLLCQDYTSPEPRPRGAVLVGNCLVWEGQNQRGRELNPAHHFFLSNISHLTSVRLFSTLISLSRCWHQWSGCLLKIHEIQKSSRKYSQALWTEGKMRNQKFSACLSSLCKLTNPSLPQTSDVTTLSPSPALSLLNFWSCIRFNLRGWGAKTVDMPFCNLPWEL